MVLMDALESGPERGAKGKRCGANAQPRYSKDER